MSSYYLTESFHSKGIARFDQNGISRRIENHSLVEKMFSKEQTRVDASMEGGYYVLRVL